MPIFTKMPMISNPARRDNNISLLHNTRKGIKIHTKLHGLILDHTLFAGENLKCFCYQRK